MCAERVGEPAEPVAKMTRVSWIRRVLERVLAPVVVRRRLPSSIGGAVIHASARVGGLKYVFRPTRKLDPELLRIARLLVRPGDCVWDVGANVGLFSVAASFLAGEKGSIHAFEADNEAVGLLHRTSRRLAVGASICVVPVAVSDRDGFLRFAIAKRARAANAIEGYGSTQTGGVSEVRVLPARALDGMLTDFRAPNVIKIDVEGAELLVLEGAGQLLAAHRPRIYCEVSGSTVEHVTILLRDLGYLVMDGEGFGREAPRPPDRRTFNVVAIHQHEMAYG